LLSVLCDSLAAGSIWAAAAGKQLQPHWMQTNSPLLSKYMLPPMHRGQWIQERRFPKLPLVVCTGIFPVLPLIRSFNSIVI
jgi:hypothetical protein